MVCLKILITVTSSNVLGQFSPLYIKEFQHNPNSILCISPPPEIKNNNNLKKITIGSNITKIGVGAFKGCKNLKTITIKSKNLKSVGKNAFKGINPKAKIKVPSSCLEKYKKLLAKKGQKSSVKITK